jgi:hypothetical protein
VAQSSDELIKREIYDYFRSHDIGIPLRIFPQSSREDQELFSKGGLTFGVGNTKYGSCDAAWFSNESWCDRYDGSFHEIRPIIALEGTDALNRGSSGNAQYQRFHHALGAVRNGVVGVYYFRKGVDPIQPDLFGMAAAASRVENSLYLVTDDLEEVKTLLLSLQGSHVQDFIETRLEQMEKVFSDSFDRRYGSDWERFADARSSIIQGQIVIKYAARNIRNFTESSQRAGHIAVGEMYLTKYLFPSHRVKYLFPRMTSNDLRDLDTLKTTDKEWFLLRNEPGVQICTLDDLIGLDPKMRKALLSVRLSPLKGSALMTYNAEVTKLHQELKNGSVSLR